MERLTLEELSEIESRLKWHGHNLGHRELEPYTATPLLHLLVADYRLLRGMEQTPKQYEVEVQMPYGNWVRSGNSGIFSLFSTRREAEDAMKMYKTAGMEYRVREI